MSSGSVVLCLRIYDELSLTVRKEWTLNSFPQFHVWSLPVLLVHTFYCWVEMASSKLFHKTSRWLFEFGWRHGQSSILLSSFTIHWAHSALLCERWEINNTRWGLALSAPLFPLSAGALERKVEFCECFQLVNGWLPTQMFWSREMIPLSSVPENLTQTDVRRQRILPNFQLCKYRTECMENTELGGRLGKVVGMV